MTHAEGISAYDPDALPPVIARYLGAQADPAARRAIADIFAAQARVVDEGIEYAGIDAIRGWLTNAASEYTYTTTYTGQQRVAADRWVVHVRVEGDFPGGVADLRFRVSIEADRIVDLVIAP